MMQHIVLGHDYKYASQKRIAARKAHIALGDQLVSEGKLVYGGAILGEDGEMLGSMLITNFDSREELDAWLEIEPYVVQGVWETVEVSAFRTGPSFS